MSRRREWDGIPDQGCIVDFGVRFCCACGGQKSYGAGKMCRKCYRERAVVKRSDTPDGEVLRCLLEGEAKGHFIETPDGWTLPEFVRRIFTDE